jgi:hypothetical protein
MKDSGCCGWDVIVLLSPRELGLQTAKKHCSKSSESLSEVKLFRTTRDRGHEQNFVAFLERIRWAAQKAYVLFIHIDVEEAANLALLIAQVRTALPDS